MVKQSLTRVDDIADEQILVKDCLPKSKPAYDVLKAIIGPTSLVAIEGDQWKRIRKMFNPAFAPNHIETLIPYILEESLVFVEKLDSVADTKQVVEMNNLTTVCSHHAGR